MSPWQPESRCVLYICPNVWRPSHMIIRSFNIFQCAIETLVVLFFPLTQGFRGFFSLHISRVLFVRENKGGGGRQRRMKKGEEEEKNQVALAHVVGGATARPISTRKRTYAAKHFSVLRWIIFFTLRLFFFPLPPLLVLCLLVLSHNV